MKIIRTENFNTNNAWGFGGKVGKRTYYDNGICVEQSRYCHRHSGTSNGNCVWVNVAEDFSVKLRTKKMNEVHGLKGIETITIFQHEESYRAIAGDVETFTQYGEEFIKIKTIKL